MRTGHPPFSNHKTPIDVMKAIVESKGVPEMEVEVSKQFKSFLSFCFKPNQEDRLNAYELLHHPFIVGDNRNSIFGSSNGGVAPEDTDKFNEACSKFKSE